MKLAEEHAQKALSLNPSEPKALLLLCVISQTKREHDNAIEYAGKAVEANPNDPFALHLLALSMRNAGRHEEAVANAREAMRLTPYYPAIFLWTLGYSSFHMRRYDDALWAGEKLLERCRKGELPNWYGYALMVAIYSELGQEEKARQYAAEMLAANPNLNWNSIAGAYPYKNQSDVDQLVNAWRKAGLK
jgi:adenylate cyclase